MSDRARWARWTAVLVLLLVLVAMPFWLSDFWLQTGLFAMCAVLGAVGLNLLTGTARQLSVGHAFFLAVGAYGYVWFASPSGRTGLTQLSGADLPTPVAFVLAIVLAGFVGALFSPIAGRLRGIYLGVATIALVFIGQYVMANATSITGGFEGRAVPPLEIFGFSFSDSSPATLRVLGHPFHALDRLWYLGLGLAVLGCILATNILRGRPGRALGAVGDQPTGSAVLGVAVAPYRAAAFVVSSLYAGAAGALLALVFQHIVPDYFSLVLSISYLAMIVIGGLGRVSGAVLGALFVTLLPQVLTHFSDALPLVGTTGVPGSGIDPGLASNYLYGAAIVLVLIFAPGGLAGLLRGWFRPAAPKPRTAPARSMPTVSASAAANHDEVISS